MSGMTLSINEIHGVTIKQRLWEWIRRQLYVSYKLWPKIYGVVSWKALWLHGVPSKI
jgi:hypothetical protein